MNIANTLVVVVFTYFLMDLIRTLISKKTRFVIREVNKNLEKMRKMPVKTLEEQKAFLNLKYPKRQFGKFRFTFRWVLNLLISVGSYFILMLIVYNIYIRLGINLNILEAIIFSITFPLLMNWALKFFRLNKGDDISVFKWW